MLHYCLLVGVLLLTGCNRLLNLYYADTLPRREG